MTNDIGRLVARFQTALAEYDPCRYGKLADRPWRGYELIDGSHTVADGNGSAFTGTDVAKTLAEWLRWL